MSKSATPFDNTIGQWTQAELQNFIENISQISPSQLPPSYASDQVQANGVTIAQSLDLTKGAQLLQDGFQYPAIAVPGASFTGDIVPIYADTSGLAAARAGGSGVLAAVSDIADATTQVGTSTGRAYFSRMYLPARAPSQNLYAFNVAVGGSYTTADIGLYKMTSMGTVYPNLTRILLRTGIGTDWNSSSTSGVKTYTNTTAVVLDAGIYYGAVLFTYSSGIGAQMAGQNVPHAQNASFLGGAPAAMHKDPETSLQASYVEADFTGNPDFRQWFAIS